MGRGIREGLIVLQGRMARIATDREKGAVVTYPSTHPYGEAFELRYDWKHASNQFQALYVQVRAAAGAANTGTLRGAEFNVRNESAQNAGTLMGLSAAAEIRGAATVTAIYGLNGEVAAAQADVSGVATLLAAVRAKVQSEDAGTITEGYLFLGENEAVTGGKRLTAIIGAKSTGAFAAARYGIDTSGFGLTLGSGNEVVLWKFRGHNGTTYYVVHDTDAATALGVVTSDPTS